MVDYEFKTTRDVYIETAKGVKCSKRNVRTKWYCKEIRNIVSIEQIFRNDGYVYRSKCLIKHINCGEKVICMPYNKVVDLIKNSEEPILTEVGYGKHI